MKTYLVQVKGVTPLIMHNCAGVDSQHEYAAVLWIRSHEVAFQTVSIQFAQEVAVVDDHPM